MFELNDYFYDIIIITVGGVPVTPDFQPVYTIIGSDGEPMPNAEDQTVIGPVDNRADLFRIAHTLASADGYERGQTYFRLLTFVYDGTEYALPILPFVVV